MRWLEKPGWSRERGVVESVSGSIGLILLQWELRNTHQWKAWQGRFPAFRMQ